MGQTKLGESKISHEAFSPLKVRFFREAMRLPITIIVQHRAVAQRGGEALASEIGGGRVDTLNAQSVG